MDFTSSKAKISAGAGIALLVAAAVFGATQLSAQSPAPGVPATPGTGAAPTPSATPAASPAAPAATTNPNDPAAKIPFSSAPTGTVKTFSKADASGKKIPYYRFVSQSDRTYVVELPVSMTRDARSRDEWVTLFSVYGRDPAADAELRALSGSLVLDQHAIWSAGRIGEQTLKVVTIKDSIGRRSREMNTWSAVHQEAKSNNDLIKAKQAWSHIVKSKSDLSKLLTRLANEKLALGKLYRDAGLFELARIQFRQTATLNIAPASREAIAKLRAIEGQQINPAEYTNAALVGIQRMSMSEIYQAAIRAQATNP